MIEYGRLYHFYTQSKVKVIRLFIFLVLFVLFAFAVARGEFIQYPLSLLSFFLMLEIFFHYKIATSFPHIAIIDANDATLSDSCTLPALDTFLFSKTTSAILKQLVHRRQIQFVMQKSNISLTDLSFIDFLKDELLKKTKEVVQQTNGRFITTSDLFAAYMLLTETRTKLLFNKHIKEEEFLHIIFWAKSTFPFEENPQKPRVVFWGEGIGEDWVSGWTPETRRYIVDLTQQVVGKRMVLRGREKEYKLLVEALSKEVKNSVILVGEPGVGRTALVDSVVLHSFEGQLPGNLYHKRFYELMIGALLAGATEQGTLELRLQGIIDELTHAGNIIVFIPQIENIVGASSFHLDLTGALLPYLREGSIRIIATTTPGAYKNFIESLTSFNDVFEVLHIEEPEKEDAIQMVLERIHDVEISHGVSFTYKAVITAVDLARRFMRDHALPGSAVSLLSLVASSGALSGKVMIGEDLVIEKVEEETHVAVAAPKEAEKDLLLHFEEKMHERVIDQEEAISEIAQAIRRFRSGLSVGVKPISFLFLGPTGVGKTETAKALASLYFGGEEKMIRLDMSEYTTLDSMNRLLGAVPGTGQERGELTDKIHDHPYSLVLLDEFEKAHHEILNLFLQILDDGRLTDNKGKTVSFASAIIIATSNAGSEFIREKITKGETVDKTFHESLLEYLQSQGIFKPELLNRFDGIIVFRPIGNEQAIAITKLLLHSFAKKLDEQDIKVTFDDRLVAKIAKEGFDQQFGARPLRRFIQENIEDFLAQKILKDEIQRGDNITMSTDENGNIEVASTQN